MTARSKRRAHWAGPLTALCATAALIGAQRHGLIVSLAIGIVIGCFIGARLGLRTALRNAPVSAPRTRPARVSAPRPATPHTTRAKTPRLLQPMQRSPECMDLQCELCDGKGCDCTCKHDPQIIADRNMARYDAEHTSTEDDPDDIPPF